MAGNAFPIATDNPDNQTMPVPELEKSAFPVAVQNPAPVAEIKPDDPLGIFGGPKPSLIPPHAPTTKTNDPLGIGASAQNNPLQDAAQKAAPMDSDQTGKVVSIARTTGLSPDVVHNNLADLQKNQDNPTPSDLSRIQQQSPKTAQFLESPVNQAVYKKAIPVMEQSEENIRAHEAGTSAISGFANEISYNSANLWASVLRSPDDLVDAISKSITVPYKAPDNSGETWQVPLLDVLTKSTVEIQEDHELGPAPIEHNAAAEYYMNLAKQLKPQPRYGDVDPVDEVGKGNYSLAAKAALEKTRGMLAALPAGLAQFGIKPLGVAAQFSQSYEEQTEAGSSSPQAGVNAALKAVAFSKLFDMFGSPTIHSYVEDIQKAFGSGASESFLKSAGAKALHAWGVMTGWGIGQQTANDAVDTFTRTNPNALLENKLPGDWETIKNSIGPALVMGGAGAALEKLASATVKPKAPETEGREDAPPGEIKEKTVGGPENKGIQGESTAGTPAEKAPEKVMPTLRKAGVLPIIEHDAMATRNKETYLAAEQHALAINAKTTDPQAAEIHAGHITEDTPAETIHFPVEAVQTYYQGLNKDPEQVFEQMGAGDSYRAAADQVGGTVDLPFSKWLGAKAGTEEYKGLTDHMKFDPLQKTAAEVEEMKVSRADVDKQMQEITQATAGGIQIELEALQKEKEKGQQQGILKGLISKVSNALKKAKPSGAVKDLKAQSMAVARGYHIMAERLVQGWGGRPEEVPNTYRQLIEDYKINFHNEDKLQGAKPEVGLTSMLDWAKKSGLRVKIDRPDTTGLVGEAKKAALREHQRMMDNYKNAQIPHTDRPEAKGAVDAKSFAGSIVAAGERNEIAKGAIYEESRGRTGNEDGWTPDATHDMILQEFYADKVKKQPPPLSQMPLYDQHSKGYTAEQERAFNQEVERYQAEAKKSEDRIAHDYKAYTARMDNRGLKPLPREDWEKRPVNKGEEKTDEEKEVDQKRFDDYQAAHAELLKDFPDLDQNKAVEKELEKILAEFNGKSGKIPLEGEHADQREIPKLAEGSSGEAGGSSQEPGISQGARGTENPTHPATGPLDPAFGLAARDVVRFYQDPIPPFEPKKESAVDKVFDDKNSKPNLDAKQNELFTPKETQPEGKDGQQSLFQSRQQAAPFYSRLQKTIETKMPESAPVKQIEGIIKEMPQEDRKWSGIDDFLKGKEKVSKADLLDYLKGNQLEIKEIQKGGEANFKPEQIKEAQKTLEEGFPLFQGEGHRGFMQMAGEPGKRSFNVYVNGNSDASTFFHELGHTFLFIMHDLAEKYDDPGIAEDLSKFYKWAGVDKWEDLKEKHHEMFARGFEYRLWEGNVPVPALKRIYDRFTEWLRRVYPSSAYMEHYFGQKMTEDMRGVYDRLLASKDEIDEAKKTSGYDASIPPGLPESLSRPLAKAERDAAGAATDQVIKLIMKDLTVLGKEEYQKHEALANEVAKRDVSEMPEFEAIETLEKQQVDAKTWAPKIAGGEGGIPNEVYKEFEKAAVAHGFKDFGDLADAIAKNPDRDQAVSQKVEDYMARFTPVQDTPAIKDLAVKAVHSDAHLDAIALRNEVLKAQESKQTPVKGVQPVALKKAQEEAGYARAKAKLILDVQDWKNARNAKVFTTREREAAVKAATSDNPKKREAYRGQRLINSALAKEAYKNQTESAKILSDLKPYLRGPGNLDKMPRGFWNQTHDLLEKSGLRQKDIFSSNDAEMSALANELHGQAISENKNPDMDEIANQTGMVQDGKGGWRRENLNEMVSRLEGDDKIWHLEENITPEILGGMENKTKLTMQELRDVHQAIKALAHVGENIDTWQTKAKTLGIKMSATNTAKSLSENVGSKFAVENRSPGQPNQKPWIEMENPKWNLLQSRLRNKLLRVAQLPDKIARGSLFLESLCQFTDAKEEAGEMHQNIFWTLRDASSTEVDYHVEKKEALDAIMKKHYGLFENWTKRMLEGVTLKVAGVDRDFTREQHLNLVRLSGTTQGYQRLLDGFGMKPDEIQAAADAVDEKDMSFILDRAADDKKWFPRAQANHLKYTGVELAPADLRPITYKGKEISEGLYHRIKYDPSKCQQAFQFQNIESLKAAMDTANTARGYTNKRLPRVFYPPRLDDGVYNEAQEELIHDLAYRGAAQDLGRFLKNRDFQGALSDAVGTDLARLPADQMRYMVAPPNDPKTPADRIINFGRVTTLIGKIGFRIGAGVFKYGSDNVKAIESLGIKDWARLQSRYVFDSKWRKDVQDYVYSKDAQMKASSQNFNYDIAGFARSWNDPTQKLKMFVYMPERIADGLVRTPLYYGLHTKAMETYDNDEDVARNVAGQITDRQLSTGNPLYHNSWQRGGAMDRAFAAAMTFQFCRFNEFWVKSKIAGLEYDKGNLGKAAVIIATGMASSFVIPGLIHWGTLEALRQGPQQPADRKRRFGLEMVHSFLGGLPPWGAAGELAYNAMTSGKKGFERLSDLHLTPVDEAYSDIAKGLYRGAQGLFGEHLSEKETEQFVQGVDRAMKMPDFVEMVMYNFWDDLHGNGFDVRDLTTRKK